MSNNLKNSAQRVQNILQSHNLTTRVIEFPDTTRTAQEAASVIGCAVAQIAKTLIFKGKISHKLVCIIASGMNRVDEKKVALIIGEPIEKPDAEFVLAHTGFVIGGVPPVGYPCTLQPLIDEDLMQYPLLWAAAGTPHAVFNITPQDLVRVTQAQIANIKK